VIERAFAKVNLALHVRRRRSDGYHELETLFAFTDFGDTLKVVAGDGLSLAVDGAFAAAAGDSEDNLVVRAARALAAAASIEADAALTLHKAIPVAAGLGGGSADAAAALRLLNAFWRLDWPLARLAELAAPLGADVPACVFSGTLAGKGRGDVLAPIDLGLAGTPCLLVNPRVAVATGPVFAAWDGCDRGPLEPVEWRTARNDLAGPATVLAPVIADVLAALASTEATFVQMSGSGATCLGLYASEVARDAAATILPPAWWSAATHLR